RDDRPRLRPPRRALPAGPEPLAGRGGRGRPQAAPRDRRRARVARAPVSGFEFRASSFALIDLEPNPQPETRSSKPLLKRLAATVAGLLAAAVVVFFATLPDVRPLKTQWPATTAFMERRRAELRREGSSDRLEWTPVRSSAISKEVPRAVIAAEDMHFREHA